MKIQKRYDLFGNKGTIRKLMMMFSWETLMGIVIESFREVGIFWCRISQEERKRGIILHHSNLKFMFS